RTGPSTSRTRCSPRCRSLPSPATPVSRPPAPPRLSRAEPAAVHSSGVRLFLAGLVPDALKQTLHAQLESVRTATPQTRWVLPEGLHLTLVFLGSVPEATVPALRDAFGGVCSHHRAMTLTLAGVETFGPVRSPRVL